MQNFRQYANFNILHVKLENAYSRSQNWEQYERYPQKAHPWAETRCTTYRSSKSDHVCALGVSRSIKQKKVYLRIHNMCFFTCSTRPPTLSQRHMDLHVWAYPRPSYIFQVSSKSVQEFRSPRENLAFPITLASRFYNSLYYRTSRDKMAKICAYTNYTFSIK